MTIDPQLTINQPIQLIQRHPAALPLLTTAGLDTCCGGGRSLREAAEQAGVGLTDLLRALEAGGAIPEAGMAGAPAGCGCASRER